MLSRFWEKKNKNINSCSEFYFPFPIPHVFHTVIGAFYRVFSVNRVHFLFLSVCTCDHLPGRGSFGSVQRGRPIGRTSGPGQTLGTCLYTHTHTLCVRPFTDKGFIGIYANVGIKHFETGLQRCSENAFRKIPCWIREFIVCLWMSRGYVMKRLNFRSYVNKKITIPFIVFTVYQIYKRLRERGNRPLRRVLHPSGNALHKTSCRIQIFFVNRVKCNKTIKLSLNTYS